MLNNKSYQTIIFECSDISLLHLKINEYYQYLNASGNFFIITDNQYNQFGIQNSFFDFIEVSVNKGFICKNIIILPESGKNEQLKKNVRYLLWCVKNTEENYFDKDKIREKHIWKDVEWGKRSQNYNPLGKDPGNVWLPTEDDGKGKIINHIALDFESVINRCIDSTCLNNSHVLIRFFSKLNQKNINHQFIEFEKYSFLFRKSVERNIKNNIDNQFKDPEATVFFDSCEDMKGVTNSSVDLMVTSPPYWDLKNYFKEGQIGQESYSNYLKRLNMVWLETYRVLKKTGQMWINVNTRTKNKNIVLIPQDIIKSCLEIGFIFKEIVIWHKSSGIPTNKSNLTDRHEYFLWFVKSEKYIINSSEIELINDYKNPLLNKGLIWNINRKAGSVGKDYIHPAIFPVSLIDRVINLTSDPGALVLDPFLGSGTSMFSALKNNRNFVGYEYNEDFDKLISHRAKNEEVEENSIKYMYKNNKKEFNNNLPVMRNKK